MKFTKKQFDEIGPWHFNDLCFDSTNQTTMLKIFNLLPSNLQGTAVSWGCDDSVFRDEVFEYLIKNQFNMTIDEYYNSEIGKEFFKNGTYQEFDFEKLKPKKVLFDIETEGVISMMDEAGNIKVVTGISKLDEIMGGGLNKGEIGIIMAPVGVGKYQPDKGRYDEKIQDLVNKHKNNA